MSKEALKMALEALEQIKQETFHPAKVFSHNHAIIAIKEALTQPEQEPVAYLCENAVGHKYFRWKKPSSTYKPIALYTAPPQRKPLTDDEIDAFMPAADGSAETDVVSVEVSPGIWGKEYSEVDAWSRPLVFQIARAIEAAHGIKENT
jgi:hypothetical protein